MKNYLSKIKFSLSTLVFILLMEIAFADEKYKYSPVDYYLVAIAAGILIWPFVIYFFMREAFRELRLKL